MAPDWLTAILEWIRAHPGAAGLTIAAVAFLEGLALIGILIPGIIILFGFGALVGLGILDLATVWFWCSLGAIVGDGVSFWLGHHFKQHLRDIWPFTRFGELITRGEEFFQQHGLKSVVIGRFIGPIRPVMPVVAGMMGMSVKRYLPANLIAGILWAPAYLLPGVVFGASIELAKAVAFRLALLLCVLVGAVWALTWTVMESYRYLAPRGSSMLAFGLGWSQRHPILGRFTRPLVDPRKPESGSLALFAALLVVAGSGLLFLLITIPLVDDPLGVNRVVGEAMAELRNPWADQLMAFFNGLGTVFVLLPSSAGVLVWLLWRRRSLAAWHWAGAVGVGMLLALALGYVLHLAESDPGGETFSVLHVAMSVVVYGFFAILIARELPARRRVWPYTVAAALVASIATARLYFGAHSVISLLAGLSLGVLWVTIIGIAYRRRMRRSFWTAPVAGVFFLLVASSGIWYAVSYADSFIESQTPARRYAVIDEADWWDRGWTPPVPEGTIPDLDERPINVQFVGDLQSLQQTLTAAGWAQPPDATWATALEMLQPSPDAGTLPILPSAWRGRSESLLLHRWSPGDPDQTVLHLWPTDVRTDDGDPLWVGLVVEHDLERLVYFFSYWTPDAPVSADLQRLMADTAERTTRMVDGVLLIR